MNIDVIINVTKNLTSSQRATLIVALAGQQGDYYDPPTGSRICPDRAAQALKMWLESSRGCRPSRKKTIMTLFRRGFKGLGGMDIEEASLIYDWMITREDVFTEDGKIYTREDLAVKHKNLVGE